MKAIIALFVLLLIVVVGTAMALNGKSFSLIPKTKTVEIHQKVFTVEVVTSEKDREKGLSGRTSLAADHGMLFVFDPPVRVAFWMKDMHFPLDLIFIRNGKVLTIFQNVSAPKPNTPDSALPIYVPEGPVDYVLEVNAGTVKKYTINKNDSVTYSL